jgi:hypothetical protein
MASGFYPDGERPMRRSLALLAVGLLLVTTVGAAPTLGAAPRSDGTTDSATLSVGNATLNLHVTPANAQVTVNGTAVSLGTDGSAAIRLAPGTYGVAATAVGFTAFLGNVTLGPDQVKFLTVHLPVQASGPGGSGGPSASLLLAIAATVAGAIAVVVLILYVRRNSTPDPEPPAPDPPPGAGSAAAARADEGPE